MKQFIAIDLKSFYASVECRERGLDPLLTNLVVADATRTEKTICLAVTPSLKAYGISGRARLFEVVSRVKEINAERRRAAPNHRFSGKSENARALSQDASLELDYIVAPPRMAYYMRYSGKIFSTYLKFVSEEDIYAYSIDEVFIDATPYLATYGISARELALRMVKAVYDETGITATAGVGTNLYLAKIAMDVEAKHCEADANGVRIAELNEESFKRRLWNHRPITDFWRVGRGYANRLAKLGAETMGDVARLSLDNPQVLFDTFGINAELLIDHAWGWENVSLADVKSYSSENHSRMSGQVLSEPYPYEKAKLVTWEMADSLALELVQLGLLAHGLGITVSYDVENIANAKRKKNYKGLLVQDGYGRVVPKPVHAKTSFHIPNSSGKVFADSAVALFERIVDKTLLVRKITVEAQSIVPESEVSEVNEPLQEDLFGFEEKERSASSKEEKASLDREHRMQKAVLLIKEKFGKNALLKAKNFQEGATARERNRQVGGHKA